MPTSCTLFVKPGKVDYYFLKRGFYSEEYEMFFFADIQEMQDPDAESHDVKPKPRPFEPTPDGDFQPVCADCGREIDVRTHDYSVKYYKRPLCHDCQKNASANR